jgi:hypothetical protein
MDRMTKQDWMAREAAANQAAARWAMSAQQHEVEANGKPWHKSNMTAMTARDNEARCKSAAKWAREMSCDVR